MDIINIDKNFASVVFNGVSILYKQYCVISKKVIHVIIFMSPQPNTSSRIKKLDHPTTVFI